MTTGLKIIRPLAITDARLISSNVAETDHPEWSSATAYTVDQYCIVVATHRIYQAKVASTNQYPPDTPYDDSVTPATGYWMEISATNKWKMFDGKSRAVTVNADAITVVITPGSLVNSLALLGLVAGYIDIAVDDPTDGDVYSATIDLYDNSGITSYYDWAFLPIVRRPIKVLLDLPAYPAATITISITDPGATVEVGECILGAQKRLGTLLYGYSVGLSDYSKKDRDPDDGSATLIEGSYSEPISFTVRVDKAQAYDIKRTLGGYRATPLVFVGSEEELESIVYGWIADYTLTRDGILYSTLDIDVEELNL